MRGRRQRIRGAALFGVSIRSAGGGLDEPQPSLQYLFSTDKNLVSHIPSGLALTYTRTGNHTYFDSSGVLQTAGENVAPFDYNPTTLASLGISVWEARTNVCLWNRDLTNAAWVASNITAAKDQTGIDGTASSASSLTATAGNATILQTVTLASSARYQSAYVKRITGSGTVNMTTDNGATWTAVTVTAAWTRVTIPTQTLANPVFGFQIVTDTDAIAVDYIQNENGAFATPAILVTDAAATRAAPAISTTDLSWFSATNGTIVSRHTTGGGASSPRIWTVANATDTASTRMYARYVSTQNQVFVSTNGNVYSNDPNQVTNVKLAFAYAANDALVAMNGSALGASATDQSVTLATGMTGLFIGMSATGTSPLNGWLSYLAYYPRRLPNATVQRLSV